MHLRLTPAVQTVLCLSGERGMHPQPRFLLPITNSRHHLHPGSMCKTEADLYLCNTQSYNCLIRMWCMSGLFYLLLYVINTFIPFLLSHICFLLNSLSCNFIGIAVYVWGGVLNQIKMLKKFNLYVSNNCILSNVLFFTHTHTHNKCNRMTATGLDTDNKIIIYNIQTGNVQNSKNTILI